MVSKVQSIRKRLWSGWPLDVSGASLKFIKCSTLQGFHIWSSVHFGRKQMFPISSGELHAHNRLTNNSVYGQFTEEENIVVTDSSLCNTFEAADAYIHALWCHSLKRNNSNTTDILQEQSVWGEKNPTCKRKDVIFFLNTAHCWKDNMVHNKSESHTSHQRAAPYRNSLLQS